MIYLTDNLRLETARQLRPLALLALSVFTLTACERAPEPVVNATAKDAASIRTQVDSDAADREKARLLGRLRAVYVKAEEAKDRREMVLPASPAFKPAAGRKVHLFLTAKSTSVPNGESLWYRLELRNVGSTPITYREDGVSCFFKCGGYSSLKISLYYRRTGSGRFYPLLPNVLAPHDPCRKSVAFRSTGWDRMSPRERDAALAHDQSLRHARSLLTVVLNPGEALLSRSWAMPDYGFRCEETDEERLRIPDPPVGYREFRSSPTRMKPGHYEIKAVFADRAPKPLTETHIREAEARGIDRAYTLRTHREWVEESLGINESDVLRFEIRP